MMVSMQYRREGKKGGGRGIISEQKIRKRTLGGLCDRRK